ncbi:MAG: response regulator [Deltaproteobacteria bacterium]|nr:response regulator [Deltaproteobacteria bacterium]
MEENKIRESHQQEILVVDDTPASLQLLTRILTDNGYRVRPASGGRLALRSVAAKTPDLILLDVKMPDMDGYEVCRHLKSDERSRDIPVLFISALGETAAKVKGFDAGGVDYIAKPFETEEVLARVGIQLRLRELTEHLEQKVRERTEELTDTNLKLRQEITERKKAEAELLKAQKLELVGILAGGIAHGFNNLLTAILGNISLAKMSPPDRIHECLAAAEKASLRAKDLTQQLLTFSRGGAPVRKTIAAGEVIRICATLALSGSKATCESVIPDDLWPIDADEGQISQVINNLLLNAIQAMSDGGRIMIQCENVAIGKESILPLKEGDYIKISIKDEGTGIPEENFEKIYDPFFTSKEHGRGLGLASTYSIIKNHKGHITVDSIFGSGATFTIYLPVAESKAEVPKAADVRPSPGAGRILIMDDEEIVRQIAGAMLTHLGYEIECANDGTKAIEAYVNALKLGRPFVAVIMDLTIPGGMGGKEAMQKLIEIDPNVKAIVSSGYSYDPIMSNFRDYGFAGVVPKPYRMDELGEQVRRVLQGGGE